MALSNLKDVYIDQLQDMYSADKQSLDATRKLKNAANDRDLRDALDRGVRGIEQGMNIVADIIRKHDADPDGEFCKGMQGLVKEVDAHVVEADWDDKDARDAMIIAQYQRMTHYGLAGYGCVTAFARRLDLNDDAEKLQQCLDNTHEGDRAMTCIAEGEVNKAAA